MALGLTQPLKEASTRSIS